MTYTKKMIERICDEVPRWAVPPECQGQHVEYSYGFAANTVCVRSYDKTDRSESYGVMPDVDLEACEPWNREPKGEIVWAFEAEGA